MKRYLDTRACFLPLLLMMVALLPACKKNNDSNINPPSITSVRNYVASPNDTVLHSAVAHGQWVVITGENLQNATQISFNGVPASYNPGLFAPNSAVVQIPQITFSTIDTTKLYTLKYTTKGGSISFPFKLGPPPPTITAISDVFANPGDSVYVYGTNLVLVQRFSYGGTPITSFKPSVDGTSIGFLMPAQTPTQQISLVAKAGSINFAIVATPTITGISNEDANPGDSVYIYGTYFKSIQSVSYAGTAINTFKSSKDGKSIGFVVPTLSQSGPVSVTTKFGTGTTVYKVNDPSTGLIANMEWSGPFGWTWNGSNLYNGTYYPGDWETYDASFSGISTNKSQFVAKKTDILKGGEGSASWPPTYEIPFDGEQWIPTADLSDAPGDWAFKFDVSVPKGWKGGTMNFVTGVGGYIARWEPWQSSPVSYSTKGWVTVTIPLSSFRAPDPALGDGMGASVSKLVDLVGSTGKTSFTLYIHNYSSSPTATGFYGAFDNFRVVKIK